MAKGRVAQNGLIGGHERYPTKPRSCDDYPVCRIGIIFT
jgi:hypothetical protein